MYSLCKTKGVSGNKFVFDDKDGICEFLNKAEYESVRSLVNNIMPYDKDDYNGLNCGLIHLKEANCGRMSYKIDLCIEKVSENIIAKLFLICDTSSMEFSRVKLDNVWDYFIWFEVLIIGGKMSSFQAEIPYALAKTLLNGRVDVLQHIIDNTSISVWGNGNTVYNGFLSQCIC